MKSVYLHRNWQYRLLGDSAWQDASVPGNIHLDLLANGTIPDPYYRSNEQDQQWIGEADWEYRMLFDVSPELMIEKHKRLVFEGLDTYADIYLNGSLIGETDNMYCAWDFDVDSLVRDKANELRIVFHSVIAKTIPMYRNTGFEYGANNSQPEPKLSMYTRKPGYHYGWDWGPRLLTCGIWRPVSLECWSDVRLGSVRFVQKSLSDDEASLELEAEVVASVNLRVTLHLTNPGNVFQEVVVATDVGQETNSIRIPFKIPSPKKWWCRGLGEPYLYELRLELLMGEQPADVWDHRIGLRTVELVHAVDAWGKSFYFKVNGIPVFIKGSNCLPPDYFIPRISTDNYRNLLNDAVAANMNMVRIWGGAIYEENVFYDLCDESGILVWQDFMFACAMYPGDERMLRRIEDEADYNIKRLRNHACLALWCGNNEIDEAWHTWGWQERYNYDDATAGRIWSDYRAIFHELLPQKVRDLDPGRAYWPSSPKYGFVDSRSRTDGDMHYWGVWFLNHPKEKFNEYLPRFMSEYGLQSMPEMRSFREFSIPEDWRLDSEVMLAHQRQYPNPAKGQLLGGYDMMLRYLEREFIVPERFEYLAYVSQLLQADYLRYAIETHRRRKPYCMGSMYWQLNDLWPVTSWSTVDYYGRWKAAHYAVRQAYSPLLISTEADGELLKHWIVNDTQAITEASIKISLMDFDGNLFSDRTIDVAIPPDSSKCYFTQSKRDLLKDRKETELVLISSLRLNAAVLSESIYYFSDVNRLRLREPGIEFRIIEESGVFMIELTARSLAKNVRISTGCDGKLSDNYFDVLPGRTRSVRFEPEDAWNRELDLLHYYAVSNERITQT